MRSILLVILFINITSILADQNKNNTTKQDNKCVFGFATCGYYDGPTGRRIGIPCTYDGPPQTITNRILLEKLDVLCPSLKVLDGSGANLCCDQNQITTFLENINDAIPFIGSCPSCLINFSRFFCDLICSPVQADFVKVIESKPYLDTDRSSVETIDYIVDEKYADGLFNSCKDIISTRAQVKALDVMCGEDCTPKSWLTFLGTKGTSPYQVNYTYVNSPSWDVNSIIPCNKKVADMYPRLREIYPDRCSMNDCPAPSPPDPDPTPGPDPDPTPGPDPDPTPGPDPAPTPGPDPDPTPRPKPSDDTPIILESVGLYILVTFLFIILAALVSIVFDSCFDHRLIDNVLKDLFRRWALFCTHYATLIILLGLALVTLSCVGLTKLQIVTDPVNLWSQKASQAHQEKTYFEDTFGPFYRAEQVIIYPNETVLNWHNYTKPGRKPEMFSNVFEIDFLMAVLDLQKRIENINVKVDGKNISITDICLKPVKPGVCVIQSPLNWFSGDVENFKKKNFTNKDYLVHFSNCFSNCFSPKDTDYEDLPCLGPYGGPVRQYLALAGYPNNNYHQATALVISIPVINKPQIDDKISKAWESEFINILAKNNDTRLRLSFYSERSIEDEIERQSHSDVFTIAISYLVMFAYVAISLGRTTSLKTFLLESRIVLGLGGVLIVLASVLTSLGILSFFGFKATLIIIEVIPFLVLAVGVDNIFIIVQALQRSTNSPQIAAMTIEHRISYVIGEVGPSLLLASLSESTCFLIGALTPMPAVRVFALTASLALFVDFILQMTVFIGLLTLDTKRQASGRYDLICCITASKSSQTSLIGSSELEAAHHHRHGTSRQGLSSLADSTSGGITPISSPNMSSRRQDCTSDAIDSKFIYPPNMKDPLLFRFFEQYFAPFLMQRPVRYIGMGFFLLWLCVSAAVIPSINVGLDPTMSVPDDSYMQDYFAAQRNDLRVGPPVFFVLKRGLDFSNKTERNAICSSQGCDGDSMVNQIIDAYKKPDITYINIPTNSWIDGYKVWGADDKCCKMFKEQKKLLNSNDIDQIKNDTLRSQAPKPYLRYMDELRNAHKFCPHDTPNINEMCTTCDLLTNRSFNPKAFNDYLDAFLNDRIRQDCLNGGAGIYSDIVKVNRGSEHLLDEEYNLNNIMASYDYGPVISTHKKLSNNNGLVTIDSAFSTFHKPLIDSQDFIEAMKAAKLIASDIQNSLNSKLRPNAPKSEMIEVFPYCFTYVFYEQYLTIWQQAIRNLAISMMTIFIVSYLLLGCDLYISIVILVTIASIVIDLMGLMYFWNVQLNAISLVNLVMAVGISVEFCSHVARSFALSKHENSVDRSKDALVKMGSSVLSGITITKIAGIVVLGFAKSKIFKVYYFRMYMGIVLVGATHGIIFMPIILSLTAKDVTRNRRVVAQQEPSSSASDSPKT